MREFPLPSVEEQIKFSDLEQEGRHLLLSKRIVIAGLLRDAGKSKVQFVRRQAEGLGALFLDYRILIVVTKEILQRL